MIDWFNLAANALWILGCAIALATLSYTSWEASVQQEKMVARLKRPSAQAALNLAGLLIFLGLGVLSDILWLKVIYTILALLFLALMVASIIAKRMTPYIPSE